MSQAGRCTDLPGGLAVHEGWLTKSPPLETQKSIFKARWRRRWVVLLEGSQEDQFSLQYYTDQSRSKLKGTINLNHCMKISSNLVLDMETERKNQPFMFSLATPDRVYHFSSDSRQLIQNWVEIISNACGRNIFFQGIETVKSKSTKVNQNKSLKDPYIHLAECYSGEKKAPKIPPRPTKSSIDVRKQENVHSFANDDIEYLDLEFPNNNDDAVIEEEKVEAQNEIIYRNIDFIKTRAFIETRRQVETNRYKLNKTNEF